MRLSVDVLSVAVHVEEAAGGEGQLEGGALPGGGTNTNCWISDFCFTKYMIQQTRRLFTLTGKTRGFTLTTLYLQHSEVRTLQAGQLERTIERLRPLQAEPTSLCHLNNKQAILPNMTLDQWEYRHWNCSDNECPSLKCIRPRQLGGQLFISTESVIAIRLSSIKVSPV